MRRSPVRFAVAVRSRSRPRHLRSHNASLGCWLESCPTRCVCGAAGVSSRAFQAPGGTINSLTTACYRFAMMSANSRIDAPSVSSDFTSKSRETLGSPASIFATRDWLECSECASWLWVTPRDFRRALRPSASLRRRSINTSSWSLKPRKSLASPPRQPFSVNFFRLSSCLRHPREFSAF